MQPTGTEYIESCCGRCGKMVSTLIIKRVSQRLSRLISFLSGDNLKAKCARGGLTLTAATAIARGMQLVRYMVLTRLLIPAELGTMAIILAATALFDTVFEVGIKQSVIQNKRGADPEYLNAAWWFQAVRGLGLFVMAFIAAPAISRFYGKSELTVLLRIAFVAIIFRGLISTSAYVLEKKFYFGKAAILNHGSVFLGTFLTIGLAFIFRDVRALVAGFVAESFLMFAISFLLCPLRPKFKVERESLADITRFARGMFGLSALTLVAFQTPIFVLGKAAVFSIVGMYAMAEQLAQTPREFFVRVFFPVLFPAFSQIQSEKRSMKSAVLKVTTGTAVFGLPIATCCIAFGGPLLTAVFGGKYTAMSAAFAFLSVCTLLRTQGVTLASVYLALGRPNLHRGFVALRAAVTLVLIYPAVKLSGAAGAAAAVLFAEVCGLSAQVFWMRRYVGIHFREYMSCWAAGAVLSLPIVGAAMFTRLMGITDVTLNLVAGSLMCFGSFMCGIALLKKGGTVRNLQCKRSVSNNGTLEKVTDILLLGASFDTGNCGVSALAESSIKCILNRWPDARITLIGEVQRTIRYEVGVRRVLIREIPIKFSINFFRRNHFTLIIGCGLLAKLLPFERVRNALLAANQYYRAISETDAAVDITGGDSFSDIYGLRRFILGFMYKLIALGCGKKLIMLPQTYGPFERAITRAAARYVIRSASAVYSRDRCGLEFLRLLMKDNDCNGKLRFAPDVAFVMDTAVPQRLDAAVARLSEKKDHIVIGFNISGLLFHGGYTRNNMFRLKADYEYLVYEIIARLFKLDAITVLLIPHVFPPDGYEVESDTAACEKVLKGVDRRYHNRLLFAGGKYDHREIKYVIGLCDFFIGSRMHACIASMSQCVPTVGIAYSEKFNGVFESVNMADCVADARCQNEREIVHKIDDVFARRGEIRRSLETIMPETKKNILNIFMEAG